MTKGKAVTVSICKEKTWEEISGVVTIGPRLEEVADNLKIVTVVEIETNSFDNYKGWISLKIGDEIIPITGIILGNLFISHVSFEVR